MPQKPFATGSTIKKLNTLADYLSFYTRALSGEKFRKEKKFRLNYFDAFAGTGEIPRGDKLPLLEGMSEISAVIDGSAKRSLATDPPFDRYFFADKKRSHVGALESLRKEFPALADRIHVLHGDANQVVTDYCAKDIGNTDRTVMFLDPYGNQVHWSTIVAIAKTKGTDLWYLFPAGLGSVDKLLHPQPH